MGWYEKDSEDYLTRVPLAKDGTIWPLVATSVDWEITNMFESMSLQRYGRVGGGGVKELHWLSLEDTNEQILFSRLINKGRI